MGPINVLAWQPTGIFWSEGWDWMNAFDRMCERENSRADVKLTWIFLGGDWKCIRDYSVHLLDQGNNKDCTRLHCSVFNRSFLIGSALTRNLSLTPRMLIRWVDRTDLKVVAAAIWCPLSTKCCRTALFIAFTVPMLREARRVQSSLWLVTLSCVQCTLRYEDMWTGKLKKIETCEVTHSWIAEL